MPGWLRTSLWTVTAVLLLMLLAFIVGGRSMLAVDLHTGDLWREEVLFGALLGRRVEEESPLHTLYKEHGIKPSRPVWDRSHHHGPRFLRARHALGEDIRRFESRLTHDELRQLLEQINEHLRKYPGDTFLHLFPETRAGKHYLCVWKESIEQRVVVIPVSNRLKDD